MEVILPDNDNNLEREKNIHLFIQQNAEDLL